VIYQDGYPAGIAEGDLAAAARAKVWADQAGVPIMALAPYYTGLNSLDAQPRQATIRQFLRCVDAAAEIGATRIRVYAGAYQPGDDGWDRKWNALVASLRELGDYAGQRGIALCVENHFNTMTVSAAATANLMRDVASPAVGALYDQANLTFTHDEAFTEAIDLQRPWIRHVHVKDLIFNDPSKPFRANAGNRVTPELRNVRSRIPGQGILDWPAVIADLARNGYDGALSLEYEYRWHPQDLPPPEEGFRTAAEYLAPLLDGQVSRRQPPHAPTTSP
jgi:sugar phosphate isomerase/epimerase